MAYTFRPLAMDDIGDATIIYNHYVAHSTVTFHIEPRTELEMAAMLLFPEGPFASYALTEEGQLLGYCALVPFSSREAYAVTAELSLYLDPDIQGRGYGQAMLEYLEREATKKGFVSLMARICADNAASIGLFEKKGYKRAGFYEKVGYKFGQILDVVAYQKVIGDR
jgi:L-amino acid N-acyltransferase YncA